MNATISKAILDLVYSGIELSRAIDMVLGQGTYQVIVDELYEELRKS